MLQVPNIPAGHFGQTSTGFGTGAFVVIYPNNMDDIDSDFACEMLEFEIKRIRRLQHKRRVAEAEPVPEPTNVELSV